MPLGVIPHLKIEGLLASGPRDLAEPRHARVLQPIQCATAEARHRPALLDVELRPLAVEALAEHGRDERRRHSRFMVPGPLGGCSPAEGKAPIQRCRGIQ